jgi:pimeloyl-ACP methyl ester carboxylesterase
MKITLPILALILAFAAITGCSDDSGSADNQYLVSYKQENLFLLDAITTLLGPLELQYPEASGLLEHAGYSVQVYSITYKTTYMGAGITASGLVCLPVADESFPVISFQNGTNTSHANAPTANPLNYNYMLLEAMASNGYVLLIPDYIGFGASDNLVHPYYQKESTATSVIDMLKAVEELMEEKTILANSDGSTYLMGYSQGGWATLSVLEALDKNAAADIEINAASCGAGAYDLMMMSQWVIDLPVFSAPQYLPYFVYSEQEFGALTDPLSHFFNEPYASAIPQLFSGEYENGQVDQALNDTMAVLLSADMLAGFGDGAAYAELRNVLTLNSVEPWQPDALIRFYHGTSDVNVPPSQTESMYEGFISAGADPGRVTYVEMAGLNHESGVIPWGIKTINWFNELESK